MAHLLNKRNGIWSFASHSEKAWHGLGQVVDHAMTSQEVIKLANLDYEVAKAPTQFTTQDGIVVPVEGYFSTYRKDTNDYLGMVKGRYEIVQNEEAFGFFDAIIDKGEAIFETAGALGNGEKIWVLAKLPDDFEVHGEKIEKYIMLTNSHDGSSSVIAGMTNIRVVCNNTLQAALWSLDNKVSIAHNVGAKDKIKEAHRVMGIASKYNDEVQNIFTQMANYKLDKNGYLKFITKIMTPDYLQVKTKDEQKEMSTRLKNTIDSCMEFAISHPTQTTDATNGTLWGVYNAISGYYNYVKDYKSNEDKFKTQFFGSGNVKMLRAFKESSLLLQN